MEEEERWLPVKGFEGIYAVSSFGRIKSFKQRKDGMILKNTNGKGDYFRIILQSKDSDKELHTSIHRLVYETFVGKVPKGYLVHHKDGNKQNNRLSNLEMMSVTDHNKLTHDEMPHLCDGMNHYNKYERPREIFMYDIDGNYLASFPNSQAAGLVTGVCARNILQVANKTEYRKGCVRRQAGGYIWSFEKNEPCLCE